MSAAVNPGPTPAPTPSPAPPPRRAVSVLGCLFTLSLLGNLAAVLVLGFAGYFYFRGLHLFTPDNALTEQHVSGKTSSANKVAIVRIDGILLEGFLDHVHRQLDQAARDHDVKAVVLRINSPGGTITASDALYRRLLQLRDGADEHPPRPLVASLVGVAASGGYYVAMPATTLFAQRTTTTGSIGVYAAFPNVEQLARTHGVVVNTIKQGELKDSGSPFHKMTDKERQVWQHTVDRAYLDFLTVVETGRPMLRDKLRQRFPVQPLDVGPPPEKGEARPKPPPYTRYRADGGVFTADQALELKLIDQIGTQEDAVKAAARAAGLGEDYQVIRYERNKGLLENLLGIQTPQPPSGRLGMDLRQFRGSFAPRLWYLTSGYEITAMLAAEDAD